MRLLIDIPMHIYEHAKEMSEDSRDEGEAMRAIANGSPAEKEKEKIKNVIIGSINDNAEALEKLRCSNILLNEDESKTYWSYLIGRRVALFECYFIVEESINGKN